MAYALYQLARWLAANSAGGKLIRAGDLPDGIDLDEIEIGTTKDQLAKLLKKVALPRQRSFDLGSITTGVTGMQGSADHRVVREKGGTRWKLYVSSIDLPDGEEIIGSYNSDQILSIVEDVGYSVDLRTWIAMGWRPLVAENE